MGAVRIPSGAKADPGAFSHCASAGPVLVDADSAASLSLADVELHNVDGDAIEVIVIDGPDGASAPDGADAPASDGIDLASVLSSLASDDVDEKVALAQAASSSSEADQSASATPAIFSSVMPLSAGGTIAFSGELPNGTWSAGPGSPLSDVTTSPDARWELEGSTLYIHCREGKVIQGGFASETAVPWYAVRDLVTQVVMDEGLQSDSMAYWFCSMTQLSDLSAAFIPEGCKDVRHLLRSSAISSVPASFILPESVRNASGMFESCVKLESLPDGFTLEGADGAGIPGADCAKVFSGCTSLSSLPEGFALPGGLSLASAFERCWSLTSLPASMASVPSDAKDVTRMFYDLSSLRILPAGFDFPAGAIGASSPELLGLPAERDVISTYCTSPSANLQSWFNAHSAAAKRALTTDATGAAYMQFMVPDGDGWKVWKTLPADKDGMVANPGAYVIEGFSFCGWFEHSSFMVPYLFDLPYNDQPYNDTVTVVYACMVSDSAVRSGNLPNGAWKDGVVGSELVDVVTDSRASWELTADGTLKIHCQNGRVVSNAAPSEGGAPWTEVRHLVKKVVMDRSLQADSMSNWFWRMGALQDAEGIFIPEGCKDANRTFQATMIKRLPSDFRLPSGIVDAQGMFETCIQLEELPVGFTFAHLEGSTKYDFVFNGCVNLRSLPDGFGFPDSARTFENAFRNCRSLAALPDGMAIPASATKVTRMFYNCASLRILPSSFDFPKTAVDANHPSFLGLPESGEATATYYPGASQAVRDYFATSANAEGFGGFGGTGPIESKSNRTLTASPTGAAYMQFKVPDFTKQPSDPDYWRIWKTVAADDEGMVSDPGPYVSEGYAFAGWFISDAPSSAARFLFDLPYDQQPYSAVATTVYAKMVSDSVPRSGNLKHGVWADSDKTVVADAVIDSRASWELTDDGTLKIHCQPGRVITEATLSGLAGQGTAPWNGVCSLVKRIEMDEALQADSMNFWFMNMSSLVDTSAVFVPDGCKGVNRLFQFTLISALPASFILPSSVADVDGMFESCAMLESLPNGFSFAHLDNMRSAWVVFNGCINLRSLPDGFAFPDGIENLNHTFSNCRSLTALPSGFAIPSATTNVDRAFYNCRSLRILPESFDFPKMATGANSPYFLGLPESDTATATYYAGTSQNVLDWFATAAVDGFGGFGGTGPAEDRSNRTLTADATGAAYMQFMVPDTTKDPSAPDYWKVWKVEAADGNGLIADPGFDFIDGYAFSGWYVSSEFYLPYDFSLPYDDQPSITVVTTVYARYVGPILDCIVPVSTELSIDVIEVITEDSAVSDEVDTLRFYTYNATPVRVSAVTTSTSPTPSAIELFPTASDRKSKVFLDLIVDGGDTIALPLVSDPSASAKSIPNGELATEHSPICRELEATVRLRTSGKPAIATSPGTYDNVASLIWTIEADK